MHLPFLALPLPPLSQPDPKRQPAAPRKALNRKMGKESPRLGTENPTHKPFPYRYQHRGVPQGAKGSRVLPRAWQETEQMGMHCLWPVPRLSSGKLGPSWIFGHFQQIFSGPNNLSLPSLSTSPHWPQAWPDAAPKFSRLCIPEGHTFTQEGQQAKFW